MANLSLVFDLLAKDNASPAFKNVGDAAENAGKKGEGFGSSISNGMKIAGGALLASGIVEGFKSFYDAAAESAKIGALTQAAITSTGGAAKVTADQVGDLVTAISNKTGVDDEAIQSGANLLLTFTNVKNEAGKGNDIFTQTTQIMTDMSAVLGTDASGSAIQLGKALNDPVNGITALTRVGVSFTEQQKDQIKTLVASGDTLGAQKVILAELSKEFGGAAAAASTPLDKLKVNLGNIQEAMGAKLIPIVNNLSDLFLTRLLPAFSQVGGIAQQAFDILFHGDFKGGPLSEDSWLVDKLFDIRDGLVKVGGIAKQAFDILFRGDFKGGPLSEDSGMVDKLFNLRDAFVKFGGEVKAFVASDTFQRWVGVAKDAGAALFKALQGLGGFVVGTLLPAFVDFGGWLGKYSGWLIPIAGAVAAVTAAWGVYSLTMTVVGGVTKAFAAIQAALNVVLSMNPIGLVVLALVALVGAFVVAYKNSETFRNVVQSAWSGIQTAASVAWGVVSGVFNALSSGLGAVRSSFKDAVGFISGAWGGLVDAVKTPIRIVFDFVNKSMIGPINGLLGKFPGGLHIPNLPGFAAGGYTGDGDKHQPMGVVHGGEYVFTKEETAKAGPANLAMLAKTLRGYDIGGFVGNIGSAIGGAVGGAVDWVKDIAEKGARKVAELVLNPLRNTAKGLIPGGNVIGDVVRGFVDKLADSVLGKSDDQDKAQQAAMTASGAIGSGVQRWAPMVAQALAMLGQPGSLIPTVLRRMNQESGGNAAAINNWDINAKNGVPSKGLMQVIDPTFRANALPGYSSNIYDPMSNILASMQYAIRRYGSLSAAYNKAGGYETGTNWVPETGPYILHKGEAVVPAAANAGWTGGGPMTIQLDGAAVTDLLEGRVVNVLSAATDRGRFNGR